MAADVSGGHMTQWAARVAGRSASELSPRCQQQITTGGRRECVDLHDARPGRGTAGNDKEKSMYRPHTNQRRRVTTAAALTALFALAVGACGSDDTTASDSSPLQASADTTALPAPVTEPPAPVTQPPVIESTPPTEPTGTGDEGVEIAQAALLQPDDLGDGWQDLGSEFTFPMTAELAASVPSCAPFVDVVLEGNTGVWAHTTLGRNTDIAFTSITVFPTEAEAAAMVAATATPEFDQCWADFNEVAIVAMGVGVDSASYETVEPPDVELGGDSSSLQALDGTLTFGATSVPDTCVCAFVQQGRTVVAFHSAAPIFTAAARRDVIATALTRVDETVA